MDDRTKCEVYTKLLNSLDQNGELKETISISSYGSQIKLIKHDLGSAVDSDQETALQMLQILMDNHVHSIQKDVISILRTDSIDQRRKNSILGSITSCVKDLLKSSNVSDLVSLYAVWKEYDTEKFAAILKEVCYDKECSEYFKKFFLTILIPLIMDTKNLMDSTKVNSIDLALVFASVMPITNLTSEEYNNFLVSLNDYIKNISELRDANFVYWHKLWMFLVRLFGKKLHHSMNLVNKLLRVVEHAFRNSSYEQRLKGYDCWKELIDNVGLDIQHISSEKQIRLLLTPLRAKFSRQEAVIIKRFEVFVYLIEKLQDRAVLVLKEFLEFCYGEVGENTDPHKAGQGKSLPELWVRSAKVLMTVIGHTHSITEQCLETEVRLKSPILTGTNISGAYYHVINSVAECCKLLKNVEMAQCKNTVLKCLWSSLLKIILDDRITNKQKCIDTVGKVLDTLLKDPDPYSHSIASIIFKEALQFDRSKVLDLVLSNLDKFMNIIFSVPLSKESYIEVEKLLAMLKSLDTVEKSSKLVETIFEGFTKYKTVEMNVDFVAEVWIFLSNELDDYARGNSLDFLIWPASHAHQLTEATREVSLYEQYKRLLVPFVERSDELHLALFKYFDRTVRNHPHLVKNVLTLVTMFNPKINSKDITNVTLEILALILQIPGLDDKAVQREKIASYLKKMYQSNVTIIHDQDTVKKLCACAEHLLRSKHYDILTYMEESLTGLPDNVKWIHGKYLAVDFLIDIFEKESDLEVSEKIHKIVELLRNVKNLDSKKDITSIMPLGGRSAKIANLVKQIPQSPDKTTSSPSSLRLFGKDIETHSPFKVVGSQLKNVKKTPSKSQTSTPPKKKEPVFIDDDSNSKFVLIDSEVKLDKSKLTEHQKETLKKRREDIPALYQDLSQSASQGLDSNSANDSKLGASDVFKKPAEVEIKEPVAKSEDVDISENRTATQESLGVEESSSSAVDKPNEEIDPDTEEPAEENKDGDDKIKYALKKLTLSIVGPDEFAVADSKRKRCEKKLKDEESKEEKSAPDEKKRQKSVAHKITTEENEGKSEVSNEETNISQTQTAKNNSSSDTSDSDESIEQLWLRRKGKWKTSVEYSEVNKNKNNIKEEKSANFIVPSETIEGETKVPDNRVTEVVIRGKTISLTQKDDDIDEKVAEMKENITDRLAVANPDAEFKTVEEPTNKDSNNRISSDQGIPIVPKEKEKKRIRRKSLALLLDDSSVEVRKSRRRSLPTEKLAQSKLFKKSTPGSLRKKQKESTNETETNNTFPEKSTQSELFKETDLERTTDGLMKHDDESDTERNANIGSLLDQPEAREQIALPENSNEISQETHSEKILNRRPSPSETIEYVIKMSRKRKRLSSSEDDDIIESSQETSISNISATKLRLSVNRRSSLIDKSSPAPNASAEIPQIIDESSKRIPKDHEEESTKNTRPDQNKVKTKTAIAHTSANLGPCDESGNFNDTKIDTSATKPRGRGRPPRQPKENAPKMEIETVAVRKRGRPPKLHKRDSTELIQDDTKPEPKNQEGTSPTPKKRGRRKKIVDNVDVLDQDKESDVSVDSVDTPKRGTRKSPRTPEKEEMVRNIIDKLKKQVFPERPPDTDEQEAIEATNTESQVLLSSDISTVYNEKSTQSQETQSQNTEDKQECSNYKALDVSTQDAKRTTQSQDTQTQDTESACLDGGDTQIYFDLPQKPKLTDLDKEIARMDTASLSLMDLEELKGFARSDKDKTKSDADKTVVEDRTLTETSTDAVAEQNTETGHLSEQNIEVRDSENNMEKGGRENEQSTESDVIASSEIAETEELVRQLADRDIEVTMEMDHCSPVRNASPGNNVGTPGPRETSLPSSPVTGDTPNRTSELLNNTSDISPIASKSNSEKSSSDDEFIEERKLVPVALKFDHEDNHDANKQKSPEKGDDAPQKMNEASPEKAEKEVEIIALGSPPKDDVNSGKDGVIGATEKSNRPSWIKQGAQATHRFFNKRKPGLNMSPSASRIKKMMSNVKPPSQSEQTDEISQEDILTFTREVPSPLAVPRGSILKRKHPDTPEDGMSPCAKRKRVNFSDPCTTSKKVFLKDDNNPSQCILSMTSEDDIDREFLEVLAANNIADTPQTESDTIETEPSLQINNPLLLRDDIPIYPELVDCEEDVSVISRKLTGPMFVNALLSKLNNRDIKTIGDLAKQSEVAIARLPFKTPMVATVYKALDNYYHKNFKSKGATDDGEKELAEGTCESPQAVEKVDVKMELSKVIERARDENLPMDTICSIIFGSADQKQVLTWVKTHYQLEAESSLEEMDVIKKLKHLIKTIGLPKIFDVLSQSSLAEESVYYDCLLKQLTEKASLSNIIEHRSLQELKTAIEENIEKKKYDKKELLDTCFLPLVSPVDWAPISHKLTVVELSDIVVNRLSTDDFGEFTKRILCNCKSPEGVKDNILQIYNVSELTSNIVTRGSPNEIMSSLTYLFLSADKDKDDLMHIFRLVSDCLVAELPPSKLMELSIEFQKKIPIKD